MEWFEYLFLFWIGMGILFVISFWSNASYDEDETPSKENKNGN